MMDRYFHTIVQSVKIYVCKKEDCSTCKKAKNIVIISTLCSCCIKQQQQKLMKWSTQGLSAVVKWLMTKESGLWNFWLQLKSWMLRLAEKKERDLKFKLFKAMQGGRCSCERFRPWISIIKGSWRCGFCHICYNMQQYYCLFHQGTISQSPAHFKMRPLRARSGVFLLLLAQHLDLLGSSY